MLLVLFLVGDLVSVSDLTPDVCVCVPHRCGALDPQESLFPEPPHVSSGSEQEVQALLQNQLHL